MKREPEKLRRKILFASEANPAETSAQCRPHDAPAVQSEGYSPLQQQPWG